MSKSQRFSRQAHEHKKRKVRQRTKKEKEQIKKRNVRKKEERMRTEIEKIMNAGRSAGISYKKSKKNITDRTHQNNVSAVNALFRELKIYDLNGIEEEKIRNYFEQQKEKFEGGNIRKGGFINNKIKALQRFYDSIKVARGLNENQKETLLKKGAFINDLNAWKNNSKIVKSKASSRYLKPNSKQQKLINDRFYYLRKSRPKDKTIELANNYHRFAAGTGARIEQGVNATLNNLEKLEDGRYIYIVNEGEDKTNKARTKVIENKHDIKFLDRLVADAKLRADRRGEAYLFELKDDKGDSLSRNKVKSNIQNTYRKHFKNIRQTTQKKVRHQENLYDVEQKFVPHSSRSISIQKELKTRSLRYKRDPKRFFEDLQEMIEFDNSRGLFRKSSWGAVAFGYESMKKRLGRELTVKEKAMYLTSCSAGHNRVDVMRDHYFSEEMENWFKQKGIN